MIGIVHALPADRTAHFRCSIPCLRTIHVAKPWTCCREAAKAKTKRVPGQFPRSVPIQLLHIHLRSSFACQRLALACFLSLPQMLPGFLEFRLCREQGAKRRMNSATAMVGCVSFICTATCSPVLTNAERSNDMQIVRKYGASPIGAGPFAGGLPTDNLVA